MASTAPVTRIVSVDMKLPAWGMPCRESISAPEQHMPTKVDALGTGIFGGLDQAGIIDRVKHGLEEVRLMAVDNDVDLVLLQTAHVHFRPDRGRRTEEDVRDLGGDHGPAPTIRKGGPAALVGDIFVVLVHAHVGSVHQLHDLAHGAPRDDPVFAARSPGSSWSTLLAKGISLPPGCRCVRVPCRGPLRCQ